MPPRTKINKIGIIGAGIMGTGIASCLAITDFETVLYDVSEAALNKANAMIFRGFDKLVEKNKIDNDKRENAEKLLDFTPHIKKACDSDMIIEAAVENMDLKKMRLNTK